MSTRRRRECGNGHRYHTREVYEPVFTSAKQRQATFAETMQRRIALHQRNIAILKRLASGEQGKDVATSLGVSPSLISLIAQGKL